MSGIFDSHTHYDDDAFSADRDSLLSALPGAGVKRIVNVGSNLKSTADTIELTRKYSFVYGAAGVHPQDTKELDEAGFSWLSQAADDEKIVAVGEIGLDYHWDDVPKETQMFWFRRQLALAKEKNLPVIIHSRDAAADTLRIIKEAGGPDFSMVIHCFSYSLEIARIYLDMGYYLGIGGVVTYKNAQKLKDVVAYMPVDRILPETDCPYLTPSPFRGQRNDSRNIAFVAREIGLIKGMDYGQVIEQLWKNACCFYRLPLD